jgi:hypothetical protein
MNDTNLLHAVLSGTYDPIRSDATRPVAFFMGDAIRAMKAQGWDRQRTSKAVSQLKEQGKIRSCPVEGFGGNAVIYGLTAD